jgi:hypothetical protein
VQHVPQHPLIQLQRIIFQDIGHVVTHCQVMYIKVAHNFAANYLLLFENVAAALR